jgi:hypothetical protein
MADPRYEAYIEGRVPELGSKAGTESFAEKLKEGLEKAVQGRRRESHSGPARVTHDQAAAEKILEPALKVLGLDKKALGELPKASSEKLVLACWLRQNTTVTLHWVAERLDMGHYTRVTQAVSRLSRRPGKKLEK